VSQELIEENKLLAIDQQHSQAVHGQLNLPLVQLDRYTDQLEMVNPRQTDHGSTVHSFMGKLLSSRKVTE
jgi:hypothetical protein